MGDQHDAVVHHDPQQNHEADLGHEVERGSGQIEKPGDSHQGKGKGEHDGKGVGQGLEQGSHHEVNHQERQQQIEKEVPGVSLLPLRPEPVGPSVAGGIVQAVHDLAQQSLPLLLLTARITHPDFGIGAAVFPADNGGRVDATEFGHLGEQDLLPPRSAPHRHRLQIFQIFPVPGPKPQPDLHFTLGCTVAPDLPAADDDAQETGH